MFDTFHHKPVPRNRQFSCPARALVFGDNINVGRVVPRHFPVYQLLFSSSKVDIFTRSRQERIGSV
jgi:hypothetical protein